MRRALLLFALACTSCTPPPLSTQRGSLVHLRQPVDSHLCGHTCVAMAAGVSIQQAVDVIGHRRATTPWELRAALARLGVETGPLTMYHPGDPLPGRAILLRWRGCYGHWTLLWDGAVLDPAPGEYRPLGMLVTGYVEIKTEPEPRPSP